ncbi:MAG: cysteine--tRNA ligase [Thiohalophilus sp.]|uniref:cysteine--tRNA ligase n=1 Tax=Thiohalophilus sp. TaxID=3028392 RepID=UPI00286FE16F|nr:cysteine--tRNA ligase [Thiohalophilus sp.]MDR9435808.1 cysteine--tRNA ligase [Thiohalophilus sp.]
MLQIHNNLTRRKEAFQPIDPANVRMYVCGMTVYDMCHIGHARVLVVFDVVYRYLCEVFGPEHVTYVRNITDIDDKIIQRASENHEPIDNLTGRYIEEMNRDAGALGVLHPNQEPRATLHMQQIIEMIGALVEKGYAYAADNGDVYYDVSQFEGYGRLSGKHIEDLRSGERIAVDEAKQDPLDFVLWKAAKPEEPAWDSPWGKGRPGWHIECSAMSTHCLGHHFDIHGGGLDLQFPHHENEIAQSEAATGETFVNVWMHNGFVRVDEEKMSKSLGNFFTIRDVLQQYAPEVLRYFILSSHYRSPLNYSDQHLDNAKGALTTLYTALRGHEEIEPAAASTAYVERFRTAMDDDFNTPEAQSVLFDLAHEINRQGDPAAVQQAAATLKYLGGLLGLLQQSPQAFLQGEAAGDGPDSDAIEALIRQRTEARANKDFAESDRIRDELHDQGVILEDGPGGTTWRRV